jgi:hypothetical protein
MKKTNGSFSFFSFLFLPVFPHVDLKGHVEFLRIFFTLDIWYCVKSEAMKNLCTLDNQKKKTSRRSQHSATSASEVACREDQSLTKKSSSVEGTYNRCVRGTGQVRGGYVCPAGESADALFRPLQSSEKTPLVRRQTTQAAAAVISRSGIGANSTLGLAITTERFSDFLALDCRLLRLTGGASTACCSTTVDVGSSMAHDSRSTVLRR